MARYLNGVIATANVFIAVAIYLQLAEMKNSSKQTDQAIAAANTSAETAKEAVKIHKNEIRPWLSAIVKETVNIKSNDFTKWVMQVHYSNVGRTPALDVDMYGAFELHEYPLAPTTQIDLLDPSKDDSDTHTNIVILPGDEKVAFVEFRSSEIPKNMETLR